MEDKTICLRDGGCPHCSSVRSLYLVNNIIYYHAPGIGYIVLDQEAKYGFRVCVQVHDVRDPEVLKIPGQAEWPMGGALETEYDVDYILNLTWQSIHHTDHTIPESVKVDMISKLKGQFEHQKEVI